MPAYYAGLPKVVRIGPREVEIKVVAKIDKGNPRGSWSPGSFGPIKLRKDQFSVKDAVDTLVHELLHAIFEISKLESSHEEDIVDTTATWLTSILMDNPGLVQWIIKSIVEGQNGRSRIRRR